VDLTSPSPLKQSPVQKGSPVHTAAPQVGERSHALAIRSVRSVVVRAARGPSPPEASAASHPVPMSHVAGCMLPVATFLRSTRDDTIRQVGVRLVAVVLFADAGST
jgi:hypothetical protein